MAWPEKVEHPIKQVRCFLSARVARYNHESLTQVQHLDPWHIWPISIQKHRTPCMQQAQSSTFIAP